MKTSILKVGVIRTRRHADINAELIAQPGLLKWSTRFVVHVIGRVPSAPTICEISRGELAGA